MHKIFALAAACMMLAVVVPTTSASEVIEESYTGALGASATGIDERAYLGLVVFPNSEDSPYTQAGLAPIGGVRLNALQGTYTNLVIKLNDATFSEDAAASTCFWHPDGDTTCNDGGDAPDYPSDIACGGAALLGAPFAGDYATVFLYSIHIEADLTPCGGSTGSVVGTFS